MEKTIKNLIKSAEELDWNVERAGNEFNLQKYSPAGQDFNILLYGKTAEELIESLDEYCDDYDVSEETYKWLDSSGHGSHGAPYDMRDLYDDMEACRDMAMELLVKWND